ncbi:MAG: hypothetical protein ACYC6Y_15750 [Thermoguttaceae bacterium]
MNLARLWNKFCGRPAEEPFDLRRDLLRPRIQRTETAALQPGLYHYLRQVDGANTRFHLRVDSGGGGVLLANATAAVRLRPAGTMIAKALLDGRGDADILATLRDTFRGVSERQAVADIHHVRSILANLESPGDNYPILNLADPAFAADASPLRKPLSADVSLADPHLLVPILDRLWDQAIPHVTLIAPAGFRRADLVRAVERAEDLGMIAGVRAQGSNLADQAFVAELAAAGLDHVNLLCLSGDPHVHDPYAGPGDHRALLRAVGHVRACRVCAVAEVPLVDANFDSLDETVRGLREAGVANFAFFAVAAAHPQADHGALAAGQLLQAAGMVEELADALGVRHLWYPPIQRSARLSLVEQVCRGPRTSGDHAIRVETDGTVYAARGPWRPLGNLLRDSWDTIAAGEPCQFYRRRLQSDTHCNDCPGLAICGADCPRSPDGWALPPD